MIECKQAIIGAIDRVRRRSGRLAWTRIPGAVCAGYLFCAPVLAQGIDLCGCAEMPSLGHFRMGDTNSYPPGTTVSGPVVSIPLPADGVLVFDSFYVNNVRSGTDWVVFKRNAANTPVTLLIKEWIQIDGPTAIRVAGNPGTNGSSTINGRGGSPGPGGYRGGDGGHASTVGTGAGGEGLGAGGGVHGAAGLNHAGHGQFFGADTGLPLSGGSGGGGGGGTTGSCSGGGGGAGGGAILIVANQSIAVYGEINANGGRQGFAANGSCSGSGGQGSGGAIRLVSARTTGGGRLYARGGDGFGSNHGLVRIESFDDSITSSGSLVIPPALRTRVVSPLVNPVASSVAITEIDGQPVPEPPRGNIGLIDLVVDAPGIISMRVDTLGVPGGTTVEVAVKPEVGGAAHRQEATLEPANCDGSGACFTVAHFNLAEGAYFAEAAATYRTP